MGLSALDCPTCGRWDTDGEYPAYHGSREIEMPAFMVMLSGITPESKSEDMTILADNDGFIMYNSDNDNTYEESFNNKNQKEDLSMSEEIIDA